MALRYQRQELLADHAGVKTYQGLDPLTGLPVLIYAFAGKPHLLLHELESENIPGILDSQAEGQQHFVVVAYAKGYQLATPPLPIDDLEFLIESARALKDAAEIGVLHGDLRPERFWVSSDHVFVEGFGLPWALTDDPYKPPEKLSSFAGDIYSWAKSALDLTTPSPRVKQLLESCLHQHPNLRPTAEQIFTALLKTKAQPVVASLPNMPISEPSPAPTTNTLEIDFTLSEEEAPPAIPAPAATQPIIQPSMQGMPRPPSSKDLADLSDLDIQIPTLEPVPKPVSPQSFPASFDHETAEPMVLQSDPGLRVPPKPQIPLEQKLQGKKAADTKQTFVKNLPPGATYRAGKAESESRVAYKDTPPPKPTFNDVFLKENTRRNNRRSFLLSALIIASLILAGVVFYLQREPIVPVTSTPVTTNYIVDVAVEPAGMPPIQLRIISSPVGSSKRAGAYLATVPGQIVLDQAGVWEFQGEFQELRSSVVRLQLPEQRSLTVAMPIPPVTPSDENTQDPNATPQTP